jgi:hypothetical protein
MLLSLAIPNITAFLPSSKPISHSSSLSLTKQIPASERSRLGVRPTPHNTVDKSKGYKKFLQNTRQIEIVIKKRLFGKEYGRPAREKASHAGRGIRENAEGFPELAA